MSNIRPQFIVFLIKELYCLLEIHVRRLSVLSEFEFVTFASSSHQLISFFYPVMFYKISNNTVLLFYSWITKCFT